MTEFINKTSTEQVKSRLAPPSRLFKALEWLVECLPRSFIEVSLTPIENIIVIRKSKGEYKSIGNTPKFKISFSSDSPKFGWYYLEASVVRNNGNKEASIQAYSDLDVQILNIPIPINQRGSIREIIYLPKDIQNFYWLPMTASGFFTQSDLVLHKITSLESTLRRIYRVTFDLWRFRNILPTDRFGLTWIGAALNLGDAYNRSAKVRINKNLPINYSSFIAKYDNSTNDDIKLMKKLSTQMSIKPVISLVMKVEIPTAIFFKDAIESICKQIYPHWELFLIVDESSYTEISTIVNNYLLMNHNIKILRLPNSMETSKTLNIALNYTKNEYIANIDQHSILTEHALFFMAQEINKHPDVAIIYSDNDSIDENNNRLSPQFKPDWNPDLFFSYNYFTNLTLYKSQLVIDLGGYRSGFEGAIEYDLSLRCINKISEVGIRHIPRVLYHSRTVSKPLEAINSSSNTSVNCGNNYAHLSGMLALESYFNDRNITVNDGPAGNYYQIKYPIPTPAVLVSIIIPTRDQLKVLKKCIESIIEKTDYPYWELLVIDNQSEEVETITYFKEIQLDPRIKVLKYNKPFNYSAINNFAIKYAEGEVLAFLNNDIEVISDGWLSEMVSHAIRPTIGAVGAKLLYPDNTIQHAGVLLVGGLANHAHLHLDANAPGYLWRAQLTQNFEAVTGACMVILKNKFQEAGLFDEENLAVAFNDVDLCLRLGELGYRNVYCPTSILYHHESISRGVDDTPEKRTRFNKEISFMKKKWAAKLHSDRSYNPNLSYAAGDFTYNWGESVINN